jgi:hypothetical protein
MVPPWLGHRSTSAVRLNEETVPCRSCGPPERRFREMGSRFGRLASSLPPVYPPTVWAVPTPSQRFRARNDLATGRKPHATRKSRSENGFWAPHSPWQTRASGVLRRQHLAARAAQRWPAPFGPPRLRPLCLEPRPPNSASTGVRTDRGPEGSKVSGPGRWAHRGRQQPQALVCLTAGSLGAFSHATHCCSCQTRLIEALPARLVHRSPGPPCHRVAPGPPCCLRGPRWATRPRGPMAQRGHPLPKAARSSGPAGATLWRRPTGPGPPDHVTGRPRARAAHGPGPGPPQLRGPAPKGLSHGPPPVAPRAAGAGPPCCGPPATGPPDHVTRATLSRGRPAGRVGFEAPRVRARAPSPPGPPCRGRPAGAEGEGARCPSLIRFLAAGTAAAGPSNPRWFHPVRAARGNRLGSGYPRSL